ncbi:MAG: hypothetical protein MUC96_14810 [Myxococcaceae bacterium]|jgi:hypothetical protein|nr:hypothetical protein [Myxococcaceae bacterium]
MTTLDAAQVVPLVTMGLGAGLVWANLWRALVVLWPRAIHLEIDDGTSDVPVAGWLEPTHDALRALGFSPVGTFFETRRAGPSRTTWAYVNAGQHLFAFVSDSPLVRARRSLLTPPEPRLEREGPAARLTFVTTAGPGRYLVSSNFRRPGASVPQVHLCAGLPGANPERLVRAHLRRVGELGAPTGDFSLDGAFALWTDWHLTVGRTELQRQHGVGLLWTLGGLGMVAGPLIGRLWSP